MVPPRAQPRMDREGSSFVSGTATPQSNGITAANPTGEEALYTQHQQEQQPLQPQTPHHRETSSTLGQQQEEEFEEQGVHGHSQSGDQQWDLQRRRHHPQQRQRSVDVLSDLVFADAELEHQFRMEHARWDAALLAYFLPLAATACRCL